MLSTLFGSKNVELVLYYLICHEKCYAKALSNEFNIAINGIQYALQKLEKDGVLVSSVEKKIRWYTFNKENPCNRELQLFLWGAFQQLSKEEQQRYNLQEDNSLFQSVVHQISGDLRELKHHLSSLQMAVR